MDPRIKNLKSTTFFGRRFTRRQIADIQQTVATFLALSRKECRRSHYFGRNPEFLVRLACRRNDWRSVRFRKLLWNSGFSVDFDRKRAFSRIESAQKQL